MTGKEFLVSKGLIKADKKTVKELKVDAVKSDKGKDKSKLSKAELIAKIAELEAVIESM
jgi:hypothetical protein